MNRNAEARIERLERRLVPRDPFNWEDYTIDEVLVLKLEEYADALARGARFTAAGEDAKKGRIAIIADHFALNVDLRAGRRRTPSRMIPIRPPWLAPRNAGRSTAERLTMCRR